MHFVPPHLSCRYVPFASGRQYIIHFVTTLSLNVADILLSAHAILSQPYGIIFANNQNQLVKSASRVYLWQEDSRRNVHIRPADNFRVVVCFALFQDMTHVLKRRVQAYATKYALNQQASGSSIASSAQCGVLVCFVCVAVTLCIAAHTLLQPCRVQQARNATQLCPFMPVLCWYPSAIFPARTRHQRPEAKSAAGVGSPQK